MNNTLQKLRMFRGMLNGQHADAGPAYVTLDLTRRCNTVCVGCYFHCVQEREPTPGDHSVQDLPVELLCRLATELAGVGTSEIVLLGEGEPLLHPGFFDIVGAFKQFGMTVRSFSNGTLLNEEVCARIVASGLDTLLVSVWGVNREEHLQNHPGITLSHLEKRREGVRMLTEAKRRAGSRTPGLRLQFILNRHNFSNIEGRIEFALASRCEEVGFAIFRDYGGMFEGLALGEAELSTLEPALDRAREVFEKRGIRHDIPQYLQRIQMGPEGWGQTSVLRRMVFRRDQGRRHCPALRTLRHGSGQPSSEHLRGDLEWPRLSLFPTRRDVASSSGPASRMRLRELLPDSRQHAGGTVLRPHSSPGRPTPGAPTGRFPVRRCQSETGCVAAATHLR